MNILQYSLILFENLDKNESFSNKRIQKLSEFTQKDVEKLNNPKIQGEN